MTADKATLETHARRLEEELADRSSQAAELSTQIESLQVCRRTGFTPSRLPQIERGRHKRGARAPRAREREGAFGPRLSQLANSAWPPPPPCRALSSSTSGSDYLRIGIPPGKMVRCLR